jgi:hypothetical protein
LQGADQGVGDEDVVDEFLAALVDAGVVVRWGHGVADVPEPLRVAVVWPVEPAGADLGAGGAEEQLAHRARTACPYVFPEGPCSGRSHRMPDASRRASRTTRGPPRHFIPGTNGIESLNSRFRQAVRRRGHFPTEQSAMKILYLTVRERRPNRSNPTGKINGWKSILNTLAITYDDRLNIN